MRDLFLIPEDTARKRERERERESRSRRGNYLLSVNLPLLNASFISLFSQDESVSHLSLTASLRLQSTSLECLKYRVTLTLKSFVEYQIGIPEEI